MVDRKQMRVYMTRTPGRLDAIPKLIKRDKECLLDRSPEGTIIDARGEVMRPAPIGLLHNNLLGPLCPR
jgi:hypothetical protein